MNKKNIFITYLAAIMVIVAFSAGRGFAASIEGTIQGLNCVVYKKICPAENQDPHIAAENIFVVLSEDNSYYFVPNLNRAILSRYFAQKVRVTGESHKKYNAIQAKQLQVYKNDEWKTVWDIEKEMLERRRLMRK